ncbi:polysaccharide deacetylase family protein [Acrocarpospora catenulata]|uniref:polysaccharide deacetylase family protein n=1 Tax=Acrocarpospora catenulata TaxID=2836182 RepID=UPI001BDA9558|nr:polysaccharide deacetylase family protein [Acrocarpospora catenulata]
MTLVRTLAVLCAAVAALALAPPAQAAKPKPATKPNLIVALGFDDGDGSHWLVGKLLKKHGLTGTFYVNSGTLGKRGMLTRKQVMALAQAGNEIGGHTVRHVRLTDLSPSVARKEICQDRKALLGMGLKVRTFAYPYGAESERVWQLARHCGYNAARTVGGLTQPGCLECGGVAETLPPRNEFRVRTPGSVRAENTLEEVQEEVLAAEEKGGLLPLVFHRVCAEGCGEYGIPPQLLDEFLGWLAARAQDGTVVRTLDTVIGGKVRPVPRK